MPADPNKLENQPIGVQFIAVIVVLVIFFSLKMCAAKMCSSHSGSSSSGSSMSSSDCYSIGYQYGRVSAMGLQGARIDPSDDVVIPVECRDQAITQQGIEDGVRSVMK